MNSLPWGFDMDKQEEFDLVRQLRTAIAEVSKSISDDTKNDYLRKYRRMLASRRLPEHMAKSPGGYYAYRAALLYGSAEDARNAMRIRDKSERGTPEWQSAMQTIQTCLTRFRRYPADPHRKHRSTTPQTLTWTDIRQAMAARGEATSRRSKISMLSYLHHKPEWRERLFAQITHRYKAAAAISSLTGCRPSELAHGIRVTLQNGQLMCVIAGSKVTDHSGQPTRALKISPESAEAEYLAGLASKGEITVSIASPKAFTEAVAAAGHRAFPHARQRFSPYVWRHATGSDLKSDADLSPEVIAAALGHSATRTQECYGRAAHGSSRSRIVGVHAVRDVRHTHHDPAARFTPQVSNASAPRLG
jgi:integrase